MTPAGGYSAGMADLPWDYVALGISKSVQASAASIRRWKVEVRAPLLRFPTGLQLALSIAAPYL